tara:strand:+ start:1049 stop:1525 length:477 start_codon:yes stop_codon:yes gene_type:complete
MGKNIEKVKKLIAGVGGKRTPGVGYTGKTIQMRKEGEIWEESTGRKFTKVDGKRQQITKIPPRGFDKCDDCKKLILKKIDQQTFNRMAKCYYCQIDFEMKLRKEDKWDDWVKEMETKRWEAILAEYEAENIVMKESDGAFDKTVANAIANHEQGLNKI